MNKNVEGINNATEIVLSIANIINDGWTPDWSDENQEKFSVTISYDEFYIDCVFSCQSSTVYFPTEEKAQLLIDSVDTEVLIRYLSHNY